ncbi:TPA: restriction endonuclease subunit S [Aeromonas veronii]
MERDQLPIVKLGKLLPQPYKNGIYKSADFYGDGTQILRITDFDNEGHLVTDELQCLHLENNEVENYKLTSRDIVINRVNSLTHIGKSILWLNNTDCTTVYESNMMRIQPDESAILPEYLIRILQSEPAREHFRKVAKRAVAQCSINQQDVKSLSFLLHPLPEQKKIAQILSTWDRAISTTEQLLANSRQQKKALMQQLLTGKKRLLDNNGVRFSGEWITIPLEKLCHINPKRPPEPKDGLVSFIPMEFVSEDAKLLSTSERFYTDVSKGFTSFLDGDTLIAKITPCFENGKGCYVQGMKNGVGFGSTEFHVLRANKLSSPLYLYYMTNTSEFRIKGEANMQGSAGQKRVTTDYLKSLKVTVPKQVEEQQKIAVVISTADQGITVLQQKLAALKQEKKALMQQLLTGKRRVKVEEAA